MWGSKGSKCGYKSSLWLRTHIMGWEKCGSCLRTCDFYYVRKGSL